MLGFLEVLRQHPEVPPIYFSSGGARYGNPARLPVDEDHPLAPLSNHAAEKAAAEMFLLVFAHQGHAVTILRPANVHGPEQSLRRGFGVIRPMLEHVRTATPMELRGDGETVRDYLYIDDLLGGCVRVLDKTSGGTFNLVSGVGKTLNQLVRVVETVTGGSRALRNHQARGVDVSGIVLDSSAAARRFGWWPAVGLEEGIVRTWVWLQRQE